jgi:replicative DNA helicase
MTAIAPDGLPPMEKIEADAAAYVSQTARKHGCGSEGALKGLGFQTVVNYGLGVDRAVALLARDPDVGAAWKVERIREVCEESLKHFGTHMGRHYSAAGDAPIPFDDAAELPPFPIDALPPVLRAWVSAEAEATQTPLDMAGMIAFGACASCIAGKLDVQVRPGWTEGANVYIAVAMEPSERKSGVFAAGFEPIYAVQQIKALAAAPAIAIAQARRELAESVLKKRKTEYAKLSGEQLQQTPNGARGAALAREIEEGAAALTRIEVPASPQLLCSDVTQEKLAMLLHEHGGRMTVASAEGTIFRVIAGRYAEGKESFDVLLLAHAGDPLHVDRVGRPGLSVPRPRLSLVCAVQPRVIQALGDSQNMHDLGLLARIFYVLPKSTVGNRSVDAPPVPDSVRDAYATIVKALASLPTPQETAQGAIAAGQPLVDTSGRIPTLALSDGARELHRDYMRGLEPRLHPQTGDLHRMGHWSGKLAGAVARIALTLHVVEHGPAGALDRSTMANAIAFGDYLLAHAGRAFGVMLASAGDADARALLAWLTKTGTKSFTDREVQRRCRAFRDGGGAKTRARLSTAIGELAARGYVRRDGARWIVWVAR